MAIQLTDELRGALGEREDGDPPGLRSDMLRLHQLAIAVFNDGSS